MGFRSAWDGSNAIRIWSESRVCLHRRHRALPSLALFFCHLVASRRRLAPLPQRARSIPALRGRLLMCSALTTSRVTPWDGSVCWPSLHAVTRAILRQITPMDTARPLTWTPGFRDSEGGRPFDENRRPPRQLRRGAQIAGEVNAAARPSDDLRGRGRAARASSST